jgi:RNA polymerase sigma factor (sigma-70 family)
VGTDAIPPRARGLPTRLVLGPALRAQSDRRLVRLVREGYEGAFEEIVRRYRRPLGRFAASIVGGRHEDVTQDSFRKALEALRRGDAEIELRPWLYRIVRNTALNDLRDRPPAAAELADDLVAGTRSAAAEAEARAEVTELVEHLRALPENQRAALLMRELDGMGHDEIGAALGISKGAARQAIARGRAAVRSGFGALLPLPWLRSLLEGGAPVEAGVGTGALAGAGATAIGAGGAGALKIGLATVVVAGSLGAGVAIDHGGAGHGASRRPDPVAVDPPSAAAPQGAFAVSRNHYGELRTHSGAAAQDVSDDSRGGDRSRGRGDADGDSHDRRGGEDRRRDHGGHEDDRHGSTVVTDGSHSDEDRGRDDEDVDRSGGGPGASSGGKDSSGDSASHSGDRSGRDGGADRGSSGRGGSGRGSGGGDDDSTKSGGGARGSGSGSDGGSRSSGGGHRSSDDGGSTPVETPASPSVQESSSGGHGSTSSSSGGSGPSSESSDASSGSGDSVDAPASGSPGGESPTASTEPPAVVEGSSGSGGGGGSPGGPSNSGDSEIHP